MAHARLVNGWLSYSAAADEFWSMLFLELTRVDSLAVLIRVMRFAFTALLRLSGCFNNLHQGMKKALT